MRRQTRQVLLLRFPSLAAIRFHPNGSLGFPPWDFLGLAIRPGQVSVKVEAEGADGLNELCFSVHCRHVQQKLQVYASVTRFLG